MKLNQEEGGNRKKRSENEGLLSLGHEARRKEIEEEISQSWRNERRS